MVKTMEILYPHNTSAATARQMQIENCLQAKLLTTPFSMISVSDLCKEIGISRRTFYTYFADKEACLDGIIDRVIQESMLLIPSSRFFEQEPFHIIVPYLEFWKTHRDFLDFIVKQDMLRLFRDRILRHFLEEDKRLFELLDTEHVKADPLIIYLYVILQVEFLLQWHAEEFRTETEEMAKKYLRVISEPMLQVKGDLADK